MWWLENSLAKHSTSLNNAASSVKDKDDQTSNSTDTLSSATTTTTRTQSGSGANLSRSHAIRIRVPLAAQNANGERETGDYDRYRTDAQSYARRVRQRLDLDSSVSRGTVATGDERIIRSLESAGYGSWYEGEEDEELSESKAGLGKRSRGGRQSVGR